MTATSQLAALPRFEAITDRELRAVDGGNPLAIGVGAFVATVGVGAAILGVAAFGYSVGKDLAEGADADCECPDDKPKK